MSSRTTSGAVSALRRIASAAEPASPTTSIASSVSMLRSPSRTIGWSSTRRTRARDDGTSATGAQGEPHVDAQAPVSGTLDHARAAYQPRALAHADEAEAAPFGSLAVEPDAVVAHLEMEPVLLASQLDVDAPRPRVLADIRERLLEDPERRRLDDGRQSLLAQVLLEGRHPSGLAGGVLHALARGRTESGCGHRRRPQRVE